MTPTVYRRNSSSGGYAIHAASNKRNVRWCRRDSLALSCSPLAGAVGASVIWHAGPFRRTIRVGQGGIGAQLSAHRQEPAIQLLASLDLLVTWAEIEADESRRGVEAFLAAMLDPLLGPRFPDRAQIPVTLPWD